jgi:hypothetical protein
MRWKTISEIVPTIPQAVLWIRIDSDPEELWIWIKICNSELRIRFRILTIFRRFQRNSRKNQNTRYSVIFFVYFLFDNIFIFNRHKNVQVGSGSEIKLFIRIRYSGLRISGSGKIFTDPQHCPKKDLQ